MKTPDKCPHCQKPIDGSFQPFLKFLPPYSDWRKQGSELLPGDVGKTLGQFLSPMGKVLANDVGKRIWLKDYGMVMENNEQRDRRYRNKKTGAQ